MKRQSVLSGVISICALAAILFAACPTGGSDNEPSPGPSSAGYTVSYKAGAGSGTPPPSRQKLASGTVITLPDQGEMIAPTDHSFDGWKAGEQTYAANASFTVTANTEFVAQWKSLIDPNKTYIRFNNLDQFPVIIYSDPSRQTEFARAPASGTGAVVETEPKPLGIAFYPRFFLTVEGIPLTYDGPSITVRVDAKMVNTISVPALTSMETDFAYIKIENTSVHSLTLNKGNSELKPIGSASGIIMSNETASYQVEPGDVSQYRFMRNTSDPLSFPESMKQFNRGVIYAFTYNGTSLTLSGSHSALQSILPAAPTFLTAETTSWNSIRLSWEPVYGATSYKLYRAKGSGSLEEIGEARDTSYTDTGLRSNTTYTYQVKALSDKSGEGPGFTSVSATTNELPEELHSPITVSNAAKMAEVLALFNDEEYAECTVALAGSFTLDTVALSNRSSNAVLTIQSEDAGEKTISLSSLSIGGKVSLVLEEDVTLEGLDSGDRLVQIDSGGSFTMKAGSKVHGNTGGGVYVDGGTFTMNGGEISGNSIASSSTYYGGGVYVNGGTFTMSGGEISGNSIASSSTYYGGGVYVKSGTFTMSGGEISDNSTSTSTSTTFSSMGGGVYVMGGTFSMSGGEISGNTGFSWGGGVFVEGGMFTMTSGTISGNSTSSGGGVFVHSGGTFIMTSGIISGNSTSSGGGGVCSIGTFTMSGGTISGNSSSFQGGGVSVDNGTFTMSGGEISGNSGPWGGGVYVYWGTFTKQSGGVIYGSNGGSLQNSASNGPAVYVISGSKKRNSTAGVGVLLDSTKSGSAGGWE
ncbi:MAG: fibronectin type III domain-containing protein [Treponema sp.]|jgi:hypothetical protein|nr:fibronectin type III domain-containing protein [Treponema sp.]